MTYHFIKVFIYIISICISMYGLNCIDFSKYIKKSKITEFYIFYIILSVILGYLFASFILDFTNLSLSI
jgi:uncharacterized integral membrane protein (TIGR02327 family)